VRKVLWIGAAEAKDIARVERLADISVTRVDLGDDSAALKDIGRYRAVVVQLPGAADALRTLLDEVHNSSSQASIVVHDENGTLDESLIRPPMSGLMHYTGPMDDHEMAAVLRSAVDRCNQRNVTVDEPWRDLLIGESLCMRELRALIRLVGPRQATVLITGETGTGKEMVARAIHMASKRSMMKMVAVNCAALPENLIEAELFGHSKGAFTGAIGSRIGRFEQAHHGTIFLDEVGEIPLEVQAKLLRVLQQRELQRLGSSENIQIDVRVLAASNADLETAMQHKRFREDLFYRLNVIPVHVPPLRDRSSDIPLLSEHFVTKVCSREGLPEKRLSADALDWLCNFNWPGNVRQLEHAIEKAVSLSGDRETLYLGDFQVMAKAIPVSIDTSAAFSGSETPLNYEQVIARMEKRLLEEALRKCGGNKAKTAAMLGMKRTTLLYKVKALEECAAS
jgi:transcriptional regulator with GAF, ATPase, and Fis domain